MKIKYANIFLQYVLLYFVHKRAKFRGKIIVTIQNKKKITIFELLFYI